MISLAIAYLRERPLTSALNVALLAISVAMLVLLMQFAAQAGERFERDARGVDLVVGAKGSPLQLILSSVFHIDQPTGNIPFSSLDLLRRDPAVARAVPLALGDSFRGYRIVGTDASFGELYEARIAQGRAFAAPLEVVLGADVAADTGAAVGQRFVGSHGLETEGAGDQGHDHAPFETVGILAPTGTVVDRLILTSYESVWDIHGIAHGHDGKSPDGEADEDHAHGPGHEEEVPARRPGILQAGGDGLEPELTALLVTYRNAAGAIRIPALVNRQTQMQSAVPAAETARLLALLGASIEGAELFAWLLASTGGLAIFVALLNMARQREGDLALLRVMGASRVQVGATVMLEGVITAALGALLGWAGAHGLLMLARRSFATLAQLDLAAWQVTAQEGLLVLGVIAIGALAAMIPALRVYRIDPARILAQA